MKCKKKAHACRTSSGNGLGQKHAFLMNLLPNGVQRASTRASGEVGLVAAAAWSRGVGLKAVVVSRDLSNRKI